MSTPSSRINLQGAVDLGALAAQQAARQQAAARASARQAEGADPSGGAGGPTAGGAAGGTAGLTTVIDVTTEQFRAEVVERSFRVPVVVDLWATWCGPCRTLSPILERLAEEYAGRFVLAKVDVDANPEISQLFQVQSIPTIVAVVMGQPVPLFMGALPEPQVRAYLDELLRVAQQQGMPGADAAAAASPVEPEEDPRFDIAVDAIERGDYEAAESAYRELLAADPHDADAAAGLAQVALMRRVEGVDPDRAVADAAADPTSVAKAITAADALLLNGRATESFAVLIAVVRSTQGTDRDAARTHLVSLFDLVGADDPAVAPARVALANALF